MITGGSGFGGSGLVHRLIEGGYSVTVLDVMAPSHATLLSDVMDRVNYLWKSVLEISREDIKGNDVVLHFAAQPDVPMGFISPKHTVYNNVMGTVSVLEACKGIDGLEKVFIASSGNAVQYVTRYPITEEQLPNPRNPYGASKGAQELLAWAWYRSYGVPVVIYRNGIVYGPNMRREIFIFKWLWNILHGLPCILEGGDQTRDPTYVTDTLDAWILGIEAEKEKVVGQLFQISYGVEYTVSQILEECMKACGEGTIPLKRVPYRPGEEGMRELFDISKARRVLGYEPKVPLELGLKKTVEWMRRL